MLTYKSFAKINWALSVLKKRDDGYHDILSLIHAIDLHDTITFEPYDKLEVKINLPISKEENIVYWAAKTLKDHCKVEDGVLIKIEKEIPTASGLGGGSSNAAVTLKALNKFWNLNLSLEKLKEIAISVGSDVPFFFHLPIALVEGKGDIVKPLQIEKVYTLLVVKPSFGISTKFAYESLRLKEDLTEKYEKINNSIWQLYKNLCEGKIEKIKIWNDFEKILLNSFPEVEEIKKKLIKAGAILSLMSGSGSAVFGVFEDDEKAKVAATAFKGKYWCRVVHTLTS
ncbi:MAG: 4-(cytidine 5'-diphospho)-2-C-methyl-D-erythritol kinase [Thermodesulfovibrio sp.]|nr:4-(cytidine 5'-diphospho)-2-C-methyl-D-erythritol kinase [Thermodesulfovibrio sp.]